MELVIVISDCPRRLHNLRLLDLFHQIERKAETHLSQAAPVFQTMNATRRTRNEEAERYGAHQEGELQEQNCTETERKDRKPQAGVFTTIASPCNKTSVAGVAMETGETQTEDEQITKFTRNEKLFSYLLPYLVR